MMYRTVCLALLTLLLAAQAAAQAPDAWPMFRADPSHTGRSQSTGPLQPMQRWQRALGTGTYASPAIARDGTVYIGSFDALHAIAPDGARRWTTPVNHFTISSPAIGADGTVYTASTGGVLHALHPQDGSTRWTFDTGAEVWSSPTIGPDGTVYIGASDGGFYALAPGDGQLRWRFDAAGEIAATPAIGPGGTLYVATLDGTLYVLAPGDGTLQNAFSVPTRVVSSPTLGPDGTLYVGGLDGTLYAIDPATDSQRWTARLGRAFISSPALGTDGTLYVGTTDGDLHAVDTATGSTRWTTDLGDAVYASPALDADGTLFVGTAPADPDFTGMPPHDQHRALDGNGHLLAVAAADGTVQWSFQTDTPLWASPSLAADGTLYFASTGGTNRNGQLFSLEAIDFTVDLPTDPTVGVDQTVRITTPDFTPSAGTLFFRRGGEREYAATPLVEQADQGVFTGQIPAAFVTPRGVEFYVHLEDGQQTQTYPSTNPAGRPAVLRVRVDGLTLPLPLPARAFRMVSLPLELETPAPAAVLPDDYGAYDPIVWRLFHWRHDRYQEFPALSAGFTPGTAFFLATRTGAPFDVERGRSVDTAEPYPVILNPGWNQVAVPFAFAVDWNDVTVSDPADAGAVREIAYYDGQEMVQDLAAINPLQPWTGYFVRNGRDRPVEIVFPNVEAEAAAEKHAVNRSHVADRGEGYVVRLSARSLSSGRVDTQNWLGFLPGAAAGEDAGDLREAPPFGDHLRLSIVEEERHYAGSFKPLDGPGSRWTLELEVAPVPERAEWVEVALEAEGRLPDGYAYHVIDEDRQQTIALVEDRFRIDVGGDRPVRRLSFVIGIAAFVAERLAGVDEHPSALYLDQNYPNPFNPETAITFGLEKPTHVVLEVYDVTGRHVTTLTEGIRPAGRHRVLWDGRDSTGRAVVSGLYFYRLRAGSFDATRKMLLLR